MSKPTRSDKSYAQLLVTACLFWLRYPSCYALEPSAQIKPIGETYSTLWIYVSTPAILVQMIKACAALPEFRLDCKKLLMNFETLSPDSQYEALRDAIGTLRTYGLILEAKPKKQGNPSPVCNFELPLHSDIRQPANHPQILQALFGQDQRWDRRKGKKTNASRYTCNAQDLTQLQQSLDALVSWVDEQLFPETLVQYDPEKAASLKSLVDLLLPIANAKVLPQSTYLPSMLIKLATYYIFLTRLDQAYALLEQSHSLRLTLSQKASSLHYLGIIHHKRQNFPLAEQHYQQALSIREQALGALHPMTTDTALHLAELYCDFGELPTLQHWLSVVLEKQQVALSLTEILQSAEAQDPLLVLIPPVTLMTIARYCLKLNNLNSAEYFYQTVIQSSSQHPEGRIYRAIAWKWLGNIAAHKLDYSEAEQYFLKAQAETVAQYGTNHSDVAMILASIAGIQHQQGKKFSAYRLYEDSLKILKTLYGDYHPLIGQYLSDLGYLLSQDPKTLAPAKLAFQRAITIFSKFYEPDNPLMLLATQGLTYCEQWFQ